MPELPRIDLDEFVESTAEIWNEARGARIFLTGGSGFVGSWLVDSFLAAKSRLGLDARMLVLTRQERVSTDPALRFHVGDIRTFSFPDGDFSHVLHGANAVGSNSLIDETIIRGTARLLEFSFARSPRKLLYLSSGAVYGLARGEAAHFSEDSSFGEPQNGYARAKQIAEKTVSAYPATIARGFAFLGPRLPLDQGFAAGNFIGDRLARQPIRIAGNGRAVRSYLYTADLAVWLWTMLFRGAAGRAYNVGSDQAVTVRQIAEQIARPAGLPVESRNDPQAGESSYVPSIERARRELGLEVTVPLDEAIRRTVDWYSSAAGAR